MKIFKIDLHTGETSEESIEDLLEAIRLGAESEEPQLKAQPRRSSLLNDDSPVEITLGEYKKLKARVYELETKIQALKKTRSEIDQTIFDLFRGGYSA